MLTRTVPSTALRLRAPGYSEDMWIGWEEQRGAEWEALTRLDCESGLLDSSRCVARHVTSASDVRPESRVCEPLKARLKFAVADDVLVETQLAAGSDDAVEFGEGRALVWHRAEHERGDPSIKRSRFTRETIADAIDHGHRDRGVCGCLLRAFA